MIRPRPLRILLAACAFLGATASGSFAEGIVCSADKVVFVTPQGTRSVSVEVADTEAERAKGLMFREHLDDGQGMIFIYEAARPVSFWMKNTLIPLDMIFVDSRGMIRLIHPEATPHDETPIAGAVAGDPDPARLMVIELPGGNARRLGLEPGMAIAYPRLPQTTAVFPCR